MKDDKKFGGGEEEIFDEELEDEEILADDAGDAPVYYEEPPEDRVVVGVRFRNSSKVYYFDPDGREYAEGMRAIVETARGQEYGYVVQGNHLVSGRDIILPLRKALRVATPEDEAHDRDNIKKAEDAFAVGVKKIAEHGLDMKLIDTEFTFDNSKLLFYFTSDGRVDFRELVKDLASVFRCRIELRQMGIRDEAKILGGLGICGRPFCCHAFLPDFVQVSIKMAKEQNLALNSAKISGACGRLMCCLRYEYDAYIEEGRLTPKIDALVNTPDGIGVVVEAKPLTGMIKVKSLEDTAGTLRVYHRDQLTPIKNGDENYERAVEEKTLEKQARAAGTTRAALKAAMTAPPERLARAQERAQRAAAQAKRPEPKRAASYTGQVTPAALRPVAPESSSASERPDAPARPASSARTSSPDRPATVVRPASARSSEAGSADLPDTPDRIPDLPEDADPSDTASSRPPRQNHRPGNRRRPYFHSRRPKNNGAKPAPGGQSPAPKKQKKDNKQ